MRNAAQQSPNLSLAVTAVSTERADRRELARLRPACDRFGVDTEHRRHLGRGQQRLSLGCARACQGKFLLADRRMSALYIWVGERRPLNIRGRRLPALMIRDGV